MPEKQERQVQNMFGWRRALTLNVIGNTHTLKRTTNKWKRRNKKGQQ